MKTLIFDAGGVLVELGPPPIRSEWLPPGQSFNTIWSEWISMQAARDFESGLTSPENFAQAMIDSLDLNTSIQSFLAQFTAWPKGVYPGTIEWLTEIKAHYNLALLSNTNELHWRRMKDEMGLGEIMQDYFLSHKLGLVKPDASIFNAVLDHLQIAATDAVFFDDNPLNVDAASALGIEALLVNGPEELRSAVAKL